MKNSLKIILGAALVGGLTLVGGAAFAGNTYDSFDYNMPAFEGGSPVGASQTKASSSVSGQITIDTVGGGYQAVAAMAKNGSISTWTAPTSGGQSRSLANNYAAGTNCWLDLETATWTYVNVEATGEWRSR